MRSYKLAGLLSESDFDVTLITTKYSHIRKIPFDKKHCLEYKNLRIKVCHGFQTNGFHTRLLNLILFNVYLLIYFISSRLAFKKFDVVVNAANLPLFFNINIIVKLMYKCRVIVDLRDLFPYSLYDDARYKNRKLIRRLLNLLTAINFYKVDILVSTIEGADVYYSKYSLNMYKEFHHINNFFHSAGKDKRPTLEVLDRLAEIKKSFKMIVGYAGSMRNSNGIELIVNSAKLLQQEGIAFVFIGGGGKVEILNSCECKNVFYLGHFDYQTSRYIVRQFDFGVVGGRFRPSHRYGVSQNKLFEYSGLSVNCISIVDTDYPIVFKNISNHYIRNFDPAFVADYIRGLANSNVANPEPVYIEKTRHPMAPVELSEEFFKKKIHKSCYLIWRFCDRQLIPLVPLIPFENLFKSGSLLSFCFTRKSNKMEIVKQLTSSNIAERLGFEHVGPTRVVKKVVTLDELSSGAIAFARDKSFTPTSGTLITSNTNKSSETTYLITAKPRLGFVRLLRWLKDECYFREIEQAPIIRRGCVIHPSAIIEPNTVIGSNSIIKAGAVIRSGVSIGNDVIIRENALIGADGFGYEKDENGVFIHFPHLGGVTILDKVEVGGNSVVCEGALKPTEIGFGSKVNAASLIGHNVKIGSNTLIHAGVVASGGCQIGNHCWIGTNATILEKRKVSNNVLVGSGTIVNKDVAENLKVVGNPMRVLGENN